MPQSKTTEISIKTKNVLADAAANISIALRLIDKGELDNASVIIRHAEARLEYGYMSFINDRDLLSSPTLGVSATRNSIRRDEPAESH